MDKAHRPFKIELEDLGAVRVVAVQGDIDFESGPAFSEALSAASGSGGGPVVVDLSGVAFMDSTGLHLLLNLVRRLTRHGRRLAVVGTGNVQRLFELTRMDGTLDLYPARSAALRAVGHGSDITV